MFMHAKFVTLLMIYHKIKNLTRLAPMVHYFSP